MRVKTYISLLVFAATALNASEKAKKIRCNNHEASFVAETLSFLLTEGGPLADSLGRGIGILTSDLYEKFLCSFPSSNKGINIQLSPCAPVMSCCQIEERSDNIVCIPSQVGVPPSSLEDVNAELIPNSSLCAGGTHGCGTSSPHFYPTFHPCPPEPRSGLSVCPRLSCCGPHSLPTLPTCPFTPIVIKGPPCTSTWTYCYHCFGYSSPDNPPKAKYRGDVDIEGGAFEVFLPTIVEPCGKTENGGGLYFPFGLPAGTTVTLNANGTYTITLPNGEEFVYEVRHSCGKVCWVVSCHYSGDVPTGCNVEDVIVVPNCAGGLSIEIICPFPCPGTDCGPEAIKPPIQNNERPIPDLTPFVPELSEPSHQSAPEPRSIPAGGGRFCR